MKGGEHPDGWITRGNHHDCWVFGAWDPLSANVVLMAEAKAIGALAQAGWKPKRTLVYASWDAEEPGLIGSTEWVETHADEWRRKAVLYVNSDDMRERTVQQHRLLDQGAFNLAADPAETSVPPERESSVPFLNFAPLDNALARLRKGAADFDAAHERATRANVAPDGGQLSRLNVLLQGIEQTLIHPRGLAGREWYRHMIYAPGLFTGYGVKTLPGVREAIEERQWEDVDRNMTIVAGVLDACSNRLDEARAAKKQ